MKNMFIFLFILNQRDPQPLNPSQMSVENLWRSFGLYTPSAIIVIK